MTVDEVVLLVDIALGLGDASACEAGDANGDGQIAINDILVAVQRLLSGCSASQ